MVRSVTRARKPAPAKQPTAKAPAEKKPAPAIPAKHKRRFHCAVCMQRPSGCVCDVPSLVEDHNQ